MGIASALGSTVSAAVVVAGVASALTGVQGAATASVVAPAPAAVQVAVVPGSSQTSWTEPAAPGLVDVHGSGVRLAVLPSGQDGGTVEVRACDRAWSADGVCAGGSWAVLERTPVSATSRGVALGLTAAVTHLRVTASTTASLVFSRPV